MFQVPSAARAGQSPKIRGMPAFEVTTADAEAEADADAELDGGLGGAGDGFLETLMPSNSSSLYSVTCQQQTSSSRVVSCTALSTAVGTLQAAVAGEHCKANT